MARSLALIPALALFACTGDTPTGPTGDTTPTDTGTPPPPCTDGVEVVTGTIAEDTTWVAECTYVLRGGVFVGLGDRVENEDYRVTLTIEPGTRIEGEAGSDAVLVVNRGGRLIAEGTESDPIVMTSSEKIGNRGRGDWGGLVINGNAPLNCDPETVPDGGYCEGTGAGGSTYGGRHPDDDSGSISYLVVEFAGSIGSEPMPGVTFNAVGSATGADYVHVHRSLGDGMSFVGGEGTIKHLLVTYVGGAMFDWTDGWSGRGQFLVLQASHDATGNHGIEGSNNAENHNYSPRSNPTLANLSVIGSPANAFSDVGLRFSEGTVATLHHAQVTGFDEACLDVDDDATFTRGIEGEDIVIQNSLIDCATMVAPDKGELYTANQIQAYFEGMTGNLAKLGASDIPADTNDDNPNAPVLTTLKTVLGGSIPTDTFFDDNDVLGGMADDDPWTDRWTSLPAN